jgi:hypothetical protein
MSTYSQARINRGQSVHSVLLDDEGTVCGTRCMSEGIYGTRTAYRKTSSPVSCKKCLKIIEGSEQAQTGRPAHGTIEAPSGVAVEIFETFDLTILVKITVTAGTSLGHAWLRADNAARAWAKKHGAGATLVRESAKSDQLPGGGVEHMYKYLWSV